MLETLDNRIKRALEDTGLPCELNITDEGVSQYIVYSYSEIPDYYADDDAQFMEYGVNVYLILPPIFDPTALKQKVRRGIYNEFETQPSCINASSGDEQRYVYEFNVTGEIYDGHF